MWLGYVRESLSVPFSGRTRQTLHVMSTLQSNYAAPSPDASQEPPTRWCSSCLASAVTSSELVGLAAKRRELRLLIRLWLLLWLWLLLRLVLRSGVHADQIFNSGPLVHCDREPATASSNASWRRNRPCKASKQEQWKLTYAKRMQALPLTFFAVRRLPPPNTTLPARLPSPPTPVHEHHTRPWLPFQQLRSQGSSRGFQ